MIKNFEFQKNVTSPDGEEFKYCITVNLEDNKFIEVYLNSLNEKDIACASGEYAV